MIYLFEAKSFLYLCKCHRDGDSINNIAQQYVRVYLVKN